MQTDPPQLAPSETVPSAAPKFGGFLIVVAVCLVIGFLQSLSSLLRVILLLRRGVWARLTTPGLTFYHPAWKPVLLFQFFSVSFMVLVALILLVLFFRKHRFFPTFIVVMIPVTFFMTLARHYVDGLIPAVASNPTYARAGSLSFV